MVCTISEEESRRRREHYFTAQLEFAMMAQTCQQVNWGFSGAWKQFGLDALPDATNDL